jgi:hypothetical protein
MVLEMVVHVPFNHLMLLLAQENLIDIVSAVMMKSLDLSLLLIVLLICIYSFIYDRSKASSKASSPHSVI